MTDTNIDTAPPRRIPIPRRIDLDAMQRHVDAGKAILLSPQPRHCIFVRYGPSWWVRSPDGYVEISGPEEIRKLDTWRRRLTEGPLWV
ncbi:hypothetical protein [Catelliglobosispora koreensis]|uniref:hypothetical protein n=1 Tax=Catelliglobosispora koreensis TaxID=129052 RepID=UPI00037F2DAE|nr:hypothetical protein [Catelliglobosispora koreensis]